MKKHIRFQYRIKDTKCLWEKITIHDSIMTLYYRILSDNREEAAKKDDLIFAVMPSEYNCVFDKDPLHDGLHLYTTQKEMLEHAKEKNKDAPESYPDIFESMLLHRHIKFSKPITITEINSGIDIFRALEPICAKEGNYKIGEYVFITENEQKDLTKSFFQYLGTPESDNSKTSIIHFPSPAFTPKYALMKNPSIFIQGQKEQLTKKLGQKFMEKYNGDLKMSEKPDENDKSLFITQIKLPLSDKGKEWFLGKIPGCIFEDCTIEAQSGGVIKIIPAVKIKIPVRIETMETLFVEEKRRVSPDMK